MHRSVYCKSRYQIIYTYMIDIITGIKYKKLQLCDVYAPPT